MNYLPPILIGELREGEGGELILVRRVRSNLIKTKSSESEIYRN